MASDFIAGCLGGCSGVLAGHAFDTVKVRLQTQNSKNPMYNSTLDCFYKIIKKESIFGLYKGITSPLYCLAVINAIIFGLQANIMRYLDDPTSYKSVALSGVLAGGVQTVICAPMELTKTFLQMQGIGERKQMFKLSNTSMYNSAFDCVKKIYLKRGLRGIFRGYNVTMVRELPAFGLYFTSFKWCCEKMSPTGKEEDMSVPALLAAGGFAGTLGWVVTYPIDVVKTRYQADGMVGRYKYSSYKDCISKSYREEGPKVFLRGFTPTILRAFPSNAATFATVSLFNQWIMSGADE